jgi:hypothetical protein
VVQTALRSARSRPMSRAKDHLKDVPYNGT